MSMQSLNQIWCLALLACLCYSITLDNLRLLLFPIDNVILSASQEEILLVAQAWNNLVFQPLHSLVCSLDQLFVYCKNFCWCVCMRVCTNIFWYINIASKCKKHILLNLLLLLVWYNKCIQQAVHCSWFLIWTFIFKFFYFSFTWLRGQFDSGLLATHFSGIHLCFDFSMLFVFAYELVSGI